MSVNMFCPQKFNLHSCYQAEFNFGSY